MEGLKSWILGHVDIIPMGTYVEMSSKLGPITCERGSSEERAHPDQC
jgi:hypothetical protein